MDWIWPNNFGRKFKQPSNRVPGSSPLDSLSASYALGQLNRFPLFDISWPQEEGSADVQIT
ncbi:unnamed protein product [Linum tenue]|uniref:Uncharacterized protein n=1 Tax=Linum tenue TaxID=586396 RepID=A0AAV0PL30_9ROSI|nr:unnamed protein product [Linum tenue]